MIFCLHYSNISSNKVGLSFNRVENVIINLRCFSILAQCIMNFKFWQCSNWSSIHTTWLPRVMKCLEYWYKSVCAVSCSAVNLDTYFHKDIDPVCVMMFCFPLWRSTDEGFIPAQPSRWVHSTTNKLQRLTVVLLSNYLFLLVAVVVAVMTFCESVFHRSKARERRSLLVARQQGANLKSCWWLTDLQLCRILLSSACTWYMFLHFFLLKFWWGPKEVA